MDPYRKSVCTWLIKGSYRKSLNKSFYIGPPIKDLPFVRLYEEPPKS